MCEHFSDGTRYPAAALLGEPIQHKLEFPIKRCNASVDMRGGRQSLAPSAHGARPNGECVSASGLKLPVSVHCRLTMEKGFVCLPNSELMFLTEYFLNLNWAKARNS